MGCELSHLASWADFWVQPSPWPFHRSFILGQNFLRYNELHLLSLVNGGHFPVGPSFPFLYLGLPSQRTWAGLGTSDCCVLLLGLWSAAHGAYLGDHSPTRNIPKTQIGKKNCDMVTKRKLDLRKTHQGYND